MESILTQDEYTLTSSFPTRDGTSFTTRDKVLGYAVCIFEDRDHRRHAHEHSAPRGLTNA